MIIAKTLQALGMVELIIALYYGIVLKDMGKEFVFLLLGIVFFLVGRILEKRAAR
jgi:hypothetical protein